MAKNFLIKQLWGDDSTIVYILGNTPYFIVYPKWFKQLQKQRRVNGLHYTDVDGLKKLISIQNSPKVVSTTNKVSLGTFNRGIETKGGVCVILSGTILLHNDVDSFSKSDKYGRRWIPWDVFENRELSRKIVQASQKVCLKFFKKKSLSTSEIYKIDSNLKDKIVAMYIGLCKDIFYLYTDEFEKQFVKPEIDPEIMDEMLISKVKIKHVIFNSILKEFVVPILKNISYTSFNTDKDNLSNSIISAITNLKEFQINRFCYLSEIKKTNKFNVCMNNYKNKMNEDTQNVSVTNKKTGNVYTVTKKYYQDHKDQLTFNSNVSNKQDAVHYGALKPTITTKETQKTKKTKSLRKTSKNKEPEQTKKVKPYPKSGVDDIKNLK